VDYLEGRAADKDMSFFHAKSVISPMNFLRGVTPPPDDADDQLKADFNELENYLDQKLHTLGAQRESEMELSPTVQGLDMSQFHGKSTKEVEGGKEEPGEQKGLKRTLSVRRRMSGMNFGTRFDGGGQVSKMVDEELKRFNESIRTTPLRERIQRYLCYFFQDPLAEKNQLAEVQKHVMLSIYLEESLQSMGLAEKNAILLGAAQMDYLSFTERRILERIHDNEEEEEEEETRIKYYPKWIVIVGWSIICGYIILLSYYILLFGVRFGSKTVNMWLESFFLGFFHDCLLFLPLKIYVIYKVLPWVLTGKLEIHRIQNMPSYCASLQVARRMPNLTASKILLEHHLPGGNDPLHRFFSDSSSKLFNWTHSFAILVLTFVVIFPYDLQDMIIETSVNTVYSHTLLGTIQVLERSKVGASFLIIFILGSVLAYAVLKFKKRKQRKKDWKEKVHGKKNVNEQKDKETSMTTEAISDLPSPDQHDNTLVGKPSERKKIGFNLTPSIPARGFVAGTTPASPRMRESKTPSIAPPSPDFSQRKALASSSSPPQQLPAAPITPPKRGASRALSKRSVQHERHKSVESTRSLGLGPEDITDLRGLTPPPQLPTQCNVSPADEPKAMIPARRTAARGQSKRYATSPPKLRPSGATSLSQQQAKQNRYDDYEGQSQI